MEYPKITEVALKTLDRYIDHPALKNSIMYLKITDARKSKSDKLNLDFEWFLEHLQEDYEKAIKEWEDNMIAKD